MSTLNLAQACVMLKQLYENRNVSESSLAMAITSLADTAQKVIDSTPTDFVAAQDDVALRFQSAAWFDVCRLLDEIDPEWLQRRGSNGIECAVGLIKELVVSRKQVEWLSHINTLHQSVEFLYVVDGFNVTITRDGVPISADFNGETVAEAISKAMEVWGIR